MFKKFIDLLTENFEKRISAKTGWGKNDVIDQFRLAIIDVLAEMKDDKYEWDVHKEPNMPHL